MPDSIDEHAQVLADAIDAALPGWVTGCVARIMQAWAGGMTPEIARAADAAGCEARRATGAAIRSLLAADIDDQRTTPLSVLRQAVRYPAEVLRAAGVPPVTRDRFAREAFPDDDYDLSPASWADFDPGLSELGITWGAAKAFEHKRRHRPSTTGR